MLMQQPPHIFIYQRVLCVVMQHGYKLVRYFPHRHVCVRRPPFLFPAVIDFSYIALRHVHAFVGVLYIVVDYQRQRQLPGLARMVSRETPAILASSARVSICFAEFCGTKSAGFLISCCLISPHPPAYSLPAAVSPGTVCLPVCISSAAHIRRSPWMPL